jgi:hypothetical protein
MRLVCSVISILLLMGCSTAPRKPASQDNSTDAPLAFLAVGPGGAQVARYLTSDATCPVAYVDGVKVQMSVRASGTADYPGTVCDAPVSAGARKVLVAGVELKTAVASPQRIVIFGDTGCRLKGPSKPGQGTLAQACNSVDAWPFARIIQSAAAQWPPQGPGQPSGPDLVIHVGDYHYREADCPPEKQEGCKDSVAGNNWTSWNQDFFAGAQPLLIKAPWVFVRGNHETCKRAGSGFFRYLDPRPLEPGCMKTTAPYLIPLGDHVLAVVDGAEITDFPKTMETLAIPGDQPVWLADHRPFLTLGADYEVTKPELQAHLPPSLAAPGRVAAVLTGHKHSFSIYQSTESDPAGGSRLEPPEIISGNGGTDLETSPTSEKPAFDYPNWGFLTLEKQAPGVWVLTEHDTYGAPVGTCTITEKKDTPTTLGGDCRN